MTVAVAVAVPAAFVAVSVYVVVCAGETDREPLAGCEPTPLSIVTEVALVVLQTSVDD